MAQESVTEVDERIFAALEKAEEQYKKYLRVQDFERLVHWNQESSELYAEQNHSKDLPLGFSLPLFTGENHAILE